MKTTFAFMNEENCADTYFKCEQAPSNESLEQPSEHVWSPSDIQNTTYTFGSMSDSNYSHHPKQASTTFWLGKLPLMNTSAEGKNKHFHKDIPLSQEFAGVKSNDLEDVSQNLSFCQITPTDKEQRQMNLIPSK